jgi:hypothetical protein
LNCMMCFMRTATILWYFFGYGWCLSIVFVCLPTFVFTLRAQEYAAYIEENIATFDIEQVCAYHFIYMYYRDTLRYTSLNSLTHTHTHTWHVTCYLTCVLLVLMAACVVLYCASRPCHGTMICTTPTRSSTTSLLRSSLPM